MCHFFLSQAAANINGKGYAGINGPLTLALPVISVSQAEHGNVLLRPHLICRFLQIKASNKMRFYMIVRELETVQGFGTEACKR
jgi:hypothetical protein